MCVISASVYEGMGACVITPTTPPAPVVDVAVVVVSVSSVGGDRDTLILVAEQLCACFRRDGMVLELLKHTHTYKYTYTHTERETER